jgi:hypothetical protein
MGQQLKKDKSLWKLLTAAAVGAGSVSVSLFGLWLVFFAATSMLGVYLLTGMYFLAWPIVFPVYTFPAAFLLLLIILPLLRKPYLQVLSEYHFWLAIILPFVIVSFTVMVFTCPLDIGGNLWTRGFEAFGTDR